jgi:hypothetical protein
MEAGFGSLISASGISFRRGSNKKCRQGGTGEREYPNEEKSGGITSVTIEADVGGIKKGKENHGTDSSTEE